MPRTPRLSESVIYLRLAHNPELGYRKLTLSQDEESLSRILADLADSLTNGFEISRIVVGGEELYRNDPISIWTKFKKVLERRTR